MLIENYRPGTLEKMGLGPDVLQARNPRLIVVRVSGWGQTGPYAQKPGFGTLVEGMSGYAAKTGFPDRAPVLPPTALADMVAGLYGAYATMIALREIEVKGGKGQVIDLSLLEPIHSVIGADAAMYKAAGIIPKRQGSRSNITSPRNVYKTRDGRWISISASMQSMAERLYAAVGVPEMIKDPRFADNSARLAHAEEAERPVVRVHRPRTTATNAWRIFEAAEVTAAPIYDIDQFVADPHVQARQIVVDVPDEEIGSVTVHNVIPRLSATPGALRRPAPKLGEHTAEVLGAPRHRRPRARRASLRKDCLMADLRPDLPAWRSLLFVPVVREKFVASRAHPRRRRHHPRPRGQRAGGREGPGAHARARGGQGGQQGRRRRAGAHQPALAPGLPRHRGGGGPGRHGADVPQGREPRASVRDRGAAGRVRGGARAAGRATPGSSPWSRRRTPISACARSPRRRRGWSPCRWARRTSRCRSAWSRSARRCEAPKQTMIIAARAAGIMPLGFMGTVADFKDLEPFRQVVRRSRKFGFAAASCIHPSVVHVLNEEYGVSPEAVDRAKRMIAAYDEVIARGIGAVTFEGKMIDVPVVEREKALLRQAERFAARRAPSSSPEFAPANIRDPGAERITILGPGSAC